MTQSKTNKRLIIIEIPKEFSKYHAEELFDMFKLICDNIDVDDLSCKYKVLK